MYWKFHRLSGVAIALLVYFGATGCGGNIQKNPIAVPVEVNRKAISTDSRSRAPDQKSVLKSTVFSALPSPKGPEFVPVADYAKGSIWFVTAYVSAASIEE